MKSWLVIGCQTIQKPGPPRPFGITKPRLFTAAAAAVVVCGTLAAHGLEIFLSKATTVMDQVADTFYVKGPDGKKLTDPQAIEALRRDLLKLSGEDHGGG